MKKGLTETEQKNYLCSKIGGSVKFKYPEPPHSLKGKLLDRVVLKVYEDELVTYWDLIDLIKFKGEDENWLRITYYRYKKKDKRWVFAGQTSLSDPISYFLDLFVTAIKEKNGSDPCSNKFSKDVLRNWNRRLWSSSKRINRNRKL